MLLRGKVSCLKSDLYFFEMLVNKVFFILVQTTELRQKSHMLQLENESLESRLNERTTQLVQHKV